MQKSSLSLVNPALCLVGAGLVELYQGRRWEEMEKQEVSTGNQEVATINRIPRLR